MEYQRGDQILTRRYWHNIVSSLSFHPTSSLALVGGSFLTTVIGYPATWTIIEPGLGTEAALYLGAALGAAWLVRTLTLSARRAMAKLEPRLVSQ